MDCSVKDRIEWVDLTRALAIAFVVLNHATESIWPLRLPQLLSVGISSRILGLACFTLGRLGVPLFLMISGCLLLDREYDEKKCLRFWRANWLRLMLVTMVWIIIYDVFLMLCFRQQISFALFLKHLFFMQQVNMSHMWYMPMALGMYVLIPFVANGIRSLPGKFLFYSILFLSLIHI